MIHKNQEPNIDDGISWLCLESSVYGKPEEGNICKMKNKITFTPTVLRSKKWFRVQTNKNHNKGRQMKKKQRNKAKTEKNITRPKQNRINKKTNKHKNRQTKQSQNEKISKSTYVSISSLRRRRMLRAVCRTMVPRTRRLTTIPSTSGPPIGDLTWY